MATIKCSYLLIVCPDDFPWELKKNFQHSIKRDKMENNNPGKTE